MQETPRYITEQEVSRITGRALATLRNDRFNKQGIPFVKMGRSIRYDIGDVVTYMEERKVTTSDLPQGSQVNGIRRR